MSRRVQLSIKKRGLSAGSSVKTKMTVYVATPDMPTNAFGVNYGIALIGDNTGSSNY